MIRQIAEQALLFVNRILPPTEPMRLSLTWPASGFFPRQVLETKTEQKTFQQRWFTDGKFDQGVIFTNADAIAVFLVDGTSLGDIEIAFVPQGCRCIFVNEHSLDGMLHRLYLVGSQAAEQHNDFDKAVALSLVLLHEMGHIHFGDRGSYSTNTALDLAELNRPSGSISNPELRADVFASEVIKLAWSSGEMESPLPGPYGRATIASNIFRVIATGFNGYDLNNDPQGILNHKQKLDLFAQKGYSHLNLYLRLLIFLQQSEPTDDRRRYLEQIAAIQRLGR